MKKEIVLIVLMFLIALLLVYAAVSKYMAFDVFVTDIRKQHFPNWLTFAVVTFLPPLEIAIAVSFIFDKTKMAGLIAALVLMTLFTIYAALVYFRLVPLLPCSCGGVIRELTWGQHLLLNTFFTGIAWYSIKLWRRQLKEGVNTYANYEPA
jgi:putative oxidoreductase